MFLLTYQLNISLWSYYWRTIQTKILLKYCVHVPCFYVFLNERSRDDMRLNFKRVVFKFKINSILWKTSFRNSKKWRANRIHWAEFCSFMLFFSILKLWRFGCHKCKSVSRITLKTILFINLNHDIMQLLRWNRIWYG